MAGNIFIVDVRDRDRVGSEKQPANFLIQSKRVPLNKNGKPYVALVLMDRTGTMEARIWDNVEELESRIDTGDFVEVQADAVSFQGRVQLKVRNIHRLDPAKADLEEYLPTSPRDRGEMLGQVRSLFESMSTAPLRSFLLGILNDEDFRRDFSRAPAAKTIHHAYLGGLLEHTLSVMLLADKMATHYTHLDRDLLLAGAFLHDLGKIKELGRGHAFDYTDEGRLVGHLVMGAMMLQDWVEAHGGLEEELVLKLTHMILSHHGSYEFGSPRRPKFAEALMLHYLDELDSKVQTFKEIAEREAGQSWTTYQRLFDRYLYLGQSPEDPASDAQTEPTKERKPRTNKGRDDLKHRPLAALAGDEGSRNKAESLPLFSGDKDEKEKR